MRPAAASGAHLAAQWLVAHFLLQRLCAGLAAGVGLALGICAGLGLLRGIDAIQPDLVLACRNRPSQSSKHTFAEEFTVRGYASHCLLATATVKLHIIGVKHKSVRF